MVTPMNETSVAHLLNLNARITDQNELQSFTNDYFGERDDSQDLSDISDSDDEPEVVKSDVCEFSPVLNLVEIVMPHRETTSIGSSSASASPLKPALCACTCKLNDGLPCLSAFDPRIIEDIRTQYLAMTNSERDISVLAKIESGIHLGDDTERPKQKQQTARRRSRNDYWLHGRHICRELFQYVHCVGEKQLNKLILHYKSNGVEARVHARTKKLPANSLSFDDNQRIVTFISNYADTHAIILPGRTPHHWVTEARLLPTNCTKGHVHRQYEESLKQTTYRIASERTFRRVWQQLMPFVTTMKPASDLCFTCQKGSTKVARSANMPDESKSAAIREMEEHLLHVTKERSYLRSVLDSAKSDLPEEAQLGRHGTCSFNGLAHYSFDFTQQVQYPSNPLQPGPIYIKVARKCGLFGIQCEALTQQVNFLIDEAVTCGKGANCVISLLHFFLESYGLGETHLHLNADNCSGQNKNSAMLWYLLWRVMTGRHIDIKLSFLITGHTKFSPDGGFGLIKRRFRRMAFNSWQIWPMSSHSHPP